MAYTDKATVEAFLNRPLTANEETLLPLVMAAVDAFINSQIGATFGNADPATRYFDGGLKFLPIDSVRSVTKIALVDTSADNNEVYVYEKDVEYELAPLNDTIKTYIEKRVGRFPAGIANIAVTGKFTLADTAPDDIKYLATYLSAKLFSKGVTGELKRESIEGYSREFAAFSVSDDVVSSILNKYTADEVLL